MMIPDPDQLAMIVRDSLERFFAADDGVVVVADGPLRVVVFQPEGLHLLVTVERAAVTVAR